MFLESKNEKGLVIKLFVSLWGFMTDAEQSQSRCLIWGTETQRMNELEHNTRI